MAKGKAGVGIRDNSRGVTIQHQHEFDDSPLPSAQELELYNTIPDVVPWLMKTAEKEQDARIQLMNEQTIIAKSNSTKKFTIDILVLCFALIIAAAGMWFSYELLLKGYKLEGAIFAGGTLALMVYNFLNFRKPKNPTSEIN
jgi:uncharacterized membrane protein